MTKLIGTDPNQVPTNGDLGDLAYQNKESVKVDTLVVEDKVGIGTSSPYATLDIERATGTVELQLQSRDSSDTFISFGDNADGDVGQINYAHSDNSMRFTTNAEERMRIKSNGDVGIGTNNPVCRLEVEDANSSASVLLKVTADDENPYSFVVGNDTFSTTDTDGMAMWINNAGEGAIDARGTGAQMRFRVQGVEAMRLNSSRNLVFPNGYGIDFSASEGSGASSSILDDYEEGTFTAEYGAVTATHTQTFGYYTKIGNMVYVNVKVTVSSIDNNDGSGIQLQMPFASGSYTGSVLFTYDSNNSDLMDGIHSKIHGARITTSTLVLTENDGTDVQYGDLTNTTGSFRFSVSYRIDS